ncbi:MAG: ATP-binding protein, partial [Anaerolineae bacterium]|nr:ATP-binding protein [Anaerolineae bacterium]
LNLRPTILEDLTLDQAIIQQLHRFETQTGLKTDFALEGYPSPLQPYIEQNLYRITQEAVTNVGRHARASRVSITLTFQPKSVSLTIVDNGIGLNGIGSLEDGRAGLSDNNKERFGIVGIKERVGLMRGKVIFETPVSGGTKIIAVIPK